MCGMDRCFLWGRVSYCAGVVVRREMLSFIGEAVLFGAAKAPFFFHSPVSVSHYFEYLP